MYVCMYIYNVQPLQPKQSQGAYVGKLSAIGQPIRPTQPFIP